MTATLEFELDVYGTDNTTEVMLYQSVNLLNFFPGQAFLLAVNQFGCTNFRQLLTAALFETAERGELP